MEIDAYQEELVMLLTNGYLDTMTYGFIRNEKWIMALKYQSVDGSLHDGNDDPGGIRSGMNIPDADFSSFLLYSQSWFSLTPEERAEFEKSSPVKRFEKNEPGIASDVQWVGDRNYSSGEFGMQRSLIEKI